MPRKKSVSGRAKAKTAENALRLQAEKINKRIRSLEKAGEYGSRYKIRDLIRFAQSNPYLIIKKSKKSKRHRLVLSKKHMPMVQLRLIRKKFNEVLKSKVFSKIGIIRARKEQRRSLRETFEEQYGKDFTNEDLDKFYELAEYAQQTQQESILDKIPPSEFFALVQVAKERKMSVSSWINLLSDYVQINNDYIRKEAEELYDKYVI